MSQVSNIPVEGPEALASCRQLLDAGSYDQALELLAPLLDEQPQLPEALHLKGLIHRAQGRMPEAIQSLIEATEASPDNPEICFDLAKAVGSIGWHEHALTVARRVIELDHEHLEAFVLIADAQQALGQHEDAVEALRRALHLSQCQQPGPEDLLASPRPLPFPATEALHYTDFSGAGDLSSFRLVGKSPDGKSQMLVDIVPQAKEDDLHLGELIGSGTVDRARLLMSLDASARAQVELFPGQTFTYRLHKLS